MSLQDPIGDMLASIKNGQMMRKVFVATPVSKLKIAILKVLEDEGYITGFETAKDEKLKTDEKRKLLIYLKYFNNKPVIEGMKRISRPGLRVYKAKDELPKIRGGFGITVVSTPKGVMSDLKARQLGQGGEVLCSVA
jgi:small subunit ribosomal protein S8